MDKPDHLAKPTQPATTAPSASTRALVEVGPTPGDREIAFDLVLDVPGRDAMAAYALDVADPASPDYRRFLRADEIGARFGLPDADLARIIGLGSGARRRRDRDLAAAAGGQRRRAGSHDRAALRRHAARLQRSRRPDVPGTGRRATRPSRADRPRGRASTVSTPDPSERPAFRGPIAAGPEDGMTPPSSIGSTSSRASARSVSTARARPSRSSRSTPSIPATSRPPSIASPGRPARPSRGSPSTAASTSPGDGQDEVSSTSTSSAPSHQRPRSSTTRHPTRRFDRGRDRPDRHGWPGRHRVDQLGVVRANRTTSWLGPDGELDGSRGRRRDQRLRGQRRPRRL